jgi:hypothetical protein
MDYELRKAWWVLVEKSSKVISVLSWYIFTNLRFFTVLDYDLLAAATEQPRSRNTWRMAEPWSLITMQGLSSAASHTRLLIQKASQTTCI